MSRSYWSGVVLETDANRGAVLSWFPALSDGMTPYKAEILCDIETDREKKLRALMTDVDGKKYRLVRTKLSGGRFTISRELIS